MNLLAIFITMMTQTSRSSNLNHSKKNTVKNSYHVFTNLYKNIIYPLQHTQTYLCII